MKVFFDTEFTGLHQNTTLISIGLVSEDGKQFYAELSDYDQEQVNPWIQENVIDKLFKNQPAKFDFYSPEWYHYGTSAEIREKLEVWLDQFGGVELVSDVCHYNMVLFINLFGTAFDLPKYVSPACHDINQDIAKWDNITTTMAFDVSRLGLLNRFVATKHTDEHNALAYALNIRELYMFMKSVDEKMKGVE